MSHLLVSHNDLSTLCSVAPASTDLITESTVNPLSCSSAALEYMEMLMGNAAD